jgi:WD40 repeat protein
MSATIRFHCPKCRRYFVDLPADWSASPDLYFCPWCGSGSLLRRIDLSEAAPATLVPAGGGRPAPRKGLMARLWRWWPALVPLAVVALVVLVIKVTTLTSVEPTPVKHPETAPAASAPAPPPPTPTPPQPAWAAEAPQLRPVPLPVARPSPLDHLDPRQIPGLERFPGLPDETVAVIGSHRGRVFGPLKCLGFSPDGHWLISGGGDGAVHFWDPETLQERVRLPAAEGAVEAFACSPDSKQIAVVSKHALEVWGMAEEGFTLRHTLEFKDEPVRSVAWSADGAALAVGGGPHEPTQLEALLAPSLFPRDRGSEWVLVYGARDGELTHWAALTDFKGPMRTLAFSPDGTVLAAGGDSGVALWNFADLTPEAQQGRQRRTMRPLLVAAALFVLLLALRVLTALVNRYGPRGWQESRRLRRGVGGTACVLGAVLLAALGSAIWFGAHDGVPGPRNLQGDGVPCYESSLVFSPDGATLAAGMSPLSGDATVAVWRRREGEWCRSATLTLGTTEEETPPKGGAVESLAFSPDGLTLVACGSGRNPFRRTWRLDGDTFQEGKELGEGPATATHVAFSPDGRLLALGEAFWDPPPVPGKAFWRWPGTEAAQLVVWEATEGGFRRRPSPPGVREHRRTEALWFSHDGGRLALEVSHGSDKRREDREVQFWDLNRATPTCRAVIALEEGERTFRDSFPPDGKLDLTHHGDLPTCRSILGLEEGNRAFRDSFSPDGKLFLTHKKGLSRLWDVAGEQARLLAEREIATGVDGECLPAVISPKGSSVVIPGADGRVRLFDIGPDGLREVAVVGAHDKHFFSYAAKFCQGGDLLTVFGDRKTIHLWNTGVRPPREIDVGHLPGGDPPTDTAFSPDGRVLHMGRNWRTIGDRLAAAFGRTGGKDTEPLTFDAWEITDTPGLWLLGRCWSLSHTRPQSQKPGPWPQDDILARQLDGASDDDRCVVLKGMRVMDTTPFGLYSFPDFSPLGAWRFKVPGPREIFHNTLAFWWESDPKYYVSVVTVVAPDHRHVAVMIDRGPVWTLRLQEYDTFDRLYASCDEALRRDPKDVAALLGRATAHLEKHRYDEALADAEAAVQHGGGARALYLRGMARACKEDYAKAKADLDEAFRPEPKLAERAPPGAMDPPGKKASESAGEKP